ncbi:MAG: alpha/beta hydrolase, partial [Pseudomonadota bacterium]
DAGAPTDLDVRDLQVDGGAGPVAARLYTPKGAAATTAGLVYFHGGGFVIGDLDTHDGFLRRLAAASGVRVLSVDYRLAPEHEFPAAHDDAIAALKWAFDHAAEIGFDPARIAVGGCSAGGNLAAVMALEIKDDPKRKLAFQLLLYPATAMEQDTQSRRDLATGHMLTAEVMEWFGDHFGVNRHADRKRAEPKFADLTGVAPALVVTAGFDPLKDEGKAYAAAINAAGGKAEHVEYGSFVHDFYTLAPFCPGVPSAIEETGARLKTALG